MAVPTHRIEIRKEAAWHKWSNDYLVSCGSMDEAEAVAVALANFEKALYNTDITVAHSRCSTVTIGDRVFRHVPHNLVGTRATTPSERLPIFCTLRVDLETADSDPCRKYFRGVLLEENQAGGLIHTSALTFFQGIVNSGLVNSVALDNIVSGKGNVVVGATVYSQVQMRQLHRRRRKKEPAEPIP